MDGCLQGSRAVSDKVLICSCIAKCKEADPRVAAGAFSQEAFQPY